MLTGGISTYSDQGSAVQQASARHLGRIAGIEWARDGADLDSLRNWAVFRRDPFNPDDSNRVWSMYALIEQEVDAPEDFPDGTLLEMWRCSFLEAVIEKLDQISTVPPVPFPCP